MWRSTIDCRRTARNRSALLLRVIIFEQLRLTCSLAERLGLLLGASGQQSHFAFERQQLLVGVGFHFESLELLHQRVTRQILVYLGGGDELAFFVLDLLGHPFERLECTLVGDRPESLLNALMRLGPLLARDEDVLLALGF